MQINSVLQIAALDDVVLLIDRAVVPNIDRVGSIIEVQRQHVAERPGILIQRAEVRYPLYATAMAVQLSADVVRPKPYLSIRELSTLTPVAGAMFAGAVSAESANLVRQGLASQPAPVQNNYFYGR